MRLGRDCWTQMAVAARRPSGHMRAQFWSFDLIFSIVIFSVALAVLAYTWFVINNQLSLNYSGASTIMSLQVQGLAGTLLSTGSPYDWQSYVNMSDSSSWHDLGIGLALAPGSSNLSVGKLYAMAAMANRNTTDYLALGSALGVGYDYYIQVRGAGYNVTMGRDPLTGNALTTQVVNEGATIGGTPVVVRVVLWTNKPLVVD